MRLESFIRMLAKHLDTSQHRIQTTDSLRSLALTRFFDDARASLSVAGPAMRAMWKEVVYTYPGLADLEIIQFLKAEIERLEQETP